MESVLERNNCLSGARAWRSRFGIEMRLIARTRMLVVGLGLVASATVLQSAEAGLRITPTVSNDRLLVTFELEGADVNAVHEAIASGLRTTFTYELELRTIVPGWIDRTIATTVVTMSDQYDNL